MRTPLAGLLALALLATAGLPRVAGADEVPTVTLEVGESRGFGGHDARCDDLTVASITVTGATLTALKPGRTVCGWSIGHAGGARTWVNVVVVPRSEKKAPARDGGKPDEAASPGAK